MNELSTLFSTDKVVEIAGQEIKIKELEAQHLPLALAIAGKLASSYKQGTTNTELVGNIMEVISKDFKLITGLIESLTDIDRAKIPKLNIAAMTLIIKEIVEVNFDFLHHNLTPVLGQFKELGQRYRGQENSKN